MCHGDDNKTKQKESSTIEYRGVAQPWLERLVWDQEGRRFESCHPIVRV